MANEYDKKIMRSVPVRLAHNPKIIIFRSFIDSLADLDAKWQVFAHLQVFSYPTGRAKGIVRSFFHKQSLFWVGIKLYETITE